MDDMPAVPGGLQVLKTRVYFRKDTGEIVDIHQFIVAPSETPSSSRVSDEMAAGEERILNRNPDASYFVVDAVDVPGSEAGLRVDVENGRLEPRSTERMEVGE